MRISILFSIFFLVSFCVISASASEQTTLFQDVPEDSYYYDSVVEMYECGAVTGYGNGIFAPQNPVSRAEALTMVCRMAGIPLEDFYAPPNWYSGAENWAKQTSVIPDSTDLTLPASREEIAQYIVNIYRLPLSDQNNAFFDTDSLYANTLKEHGIANGYMDSFGNPIFGSNLNIRRCDLCVMLVQLKRREPQPDWSDAFVVPTVIDGSFRYDDTPGTSPKNAEDFRVLFRYMMKNGITEYQLHWSGIPSTSEVFSDLLSQNICYGYNLASEDCIQYSAFYSAVGAKFISGILDSSTNQFNEINYTVYFKTRGDSNESELQEQLRLFDEECKAVVYSMYRTGQLTQSMSYKEKALVLFQYVASRFSYDLDYTGTSPYLSVTTNHAVCEGYTAFYNALCHYAGVPVFAVYGNVSGNGHVWTGIYENGSLYYIDVTNGDSAANIKHYNKVVIVNGKVVYTEEAGSDSANLAYFWINEDLLHILSPATELRFGPLSVPYDYPSPLPVPDH